MAGAAAAASRDARLHRLQAFHQADPANDALLAELCDEALTQGRAELAMDCIAAARNMALDSAAWTFRGARTALLARNFPLARELIAQARVRGMADWLLDHDEACAAWLAGDAQECRRIVGPWVDRIRRSALSPEALESFAVLWLRATHAAGLVDEGCAWADEWARDGSLGRAAGPAALLAVDADRFEDAGRLAAQAIALDPDQPEARLACATVTLARGDARTAASMLERLLARHPQDGRSWSALGLAQLKLGDIASARRSLQRAALALPRHVGSWHALGWACLAGGDRDAALDAFRHALALDGNFAESHGAVGLMLQLEGDEQQASHHISVAARLDPANLTGRLARALARGLVLSPERASGLAARLLDRPGLFGRSMAEEVEAILQPRQ